MDDLISLMPENDSAMVKLQALQKELSEQLEAVQVEFNTKALDYQKNAATLSDAVKEMRQKELDGVQQRYQELSRLATQQFQKAQMDLFDPVLKKAQAAIDKVSKEKQFHAGVQYGQRTAGLLQRGNGNRHPSSVEKGIEPERQADYSGDRRGGAYGSRDPGSEITGFIKYKRLLEEEPFYAGMPRGGLSYPFGPFTVVVRSGFLRWFR